ncbi:acyltransferase [Synechococcus sp. PCC 6312]|uniref:acyltransferase family protein n=1 Tax=Synechococcus sp. (strain ATCC 27167 / PCC 6312) TaxID=195253 RepID=UPI00029EEB23|nr:acyltransferase [Synechococcus sp. PCC 6312]AFY59414.1 putative acyltransferase [Synechococcus sp. PCC 6312]
MKLQRLEAVRGCAAVYVVLGHLFPNNFILSFGQEAVIVFFLLAGFVIEYSSRKTLDKGFIYYFNKRFIRIYSILICLFLVVILLQKTQLSSIQFWGQLAGNLLMLQDFGTGKPNVIVPTLFASALWSLHYEWWFYMFYFPAATMLKREKQTLVIGVTGLVSVITYLIYPNFISRLLFYFPVWWTGVVIARIYIENKKIEWRTLKVSCFSMMAVSTILFISCIHYIAYRGGKFTPGIHPFLEFRHITAALVIIAMALGWQKLKWIGFNQILGWGCWIAPVSYALYIAHQPLFVDASYLKDYMNPIVAKIFYFLILILFCLATELWLYPKLRKKIK